MTSPLDIKRKQDESIDDYLLRLGNNKELYSLNWIQVSEYMNEAANEDFGESKWRKDYFLIKRGFDLAIKNNVSENEVLKELQDRTIDFQKSKFQFQDQKREFTNEIRKLARFEHLKEEIDKAILEVAKIKPLNFRNNSSLTSSNRRGIALWSDWHVGADFKNSLNTYNVEVFRESVQKLLVKTIEFGKQNNIDELIVSQLGDSIMGAIHVSARVQSSEDVIKQIQIVSEVIAECIAELANTFNKVKLINIIGNHSRMISSKTESIFTENLENLIPWYLETRLSGFKNVEIAKDDDGYYIEDIEGEKFVFVHGDLDHVSSVAKTLPQMLGIVPKFIFAGHIHHNTVKEHGRTTVITNGSLMGVDTYAISKRFFAEPMQKFMIFEGTDIECTYDIKVR